MSMGGAERGGDTGSKAGSRLCAQSLMRGSNSQTTRSWPEPKSDAQPIEPPRRPRRVVLIYISHQVTPVLNAFPLPLGQGLRFELLASSTKALHKCDPCQPFFFFFLVYCTCFIKMVLVFTVSAESFPRRSHTHSDAPIQHPYHSPMHPHQWDVRVRLLKLGSCWGTKLLIWFSIFFKREKAWGNAFGHYNAN